MTSRIVIIGGGVVGLAEAYMDGDWDSPDLAALLERCGEDPFLLENEVDKLCALSGYQTVDRKSVV